jgi:hypothetical protein
MKNITLVSVILLFFASCSSDSIAPAATPTETAKVAKQVHFSNDSFLLSYNPDHTLKKAECEDGYYRLAYSNGNINRVWGQMNGVAFDVYFTYSADHHLTGVVKNGIVNTVAYNPAQQYYEIFNTTQTNARYEYLLNNDGDVIEIRRFDHLGHFLNGNTYYYESTQKGPLYNSNRVTLQLAIACPAKVLQSCALGGYRPFKHYAGANAVPIIVENTFDADGYVVDSNNEEDNFATFLYTNI